LAKFALITMRLNSSGLEGQLALYLRTQPEAVASGVRRTDGILPAGTTASIRPRRQRQR
jgi:hypothetical protein